SCSLFGAVRDGSAVDLDLELRDANFTDYMTLQDFEVVVHTTPVSGQPYFGLRSDAFFDIEHLGQFRAHVEGTVGPSSLEFSAQTDGHVTIDMGATGLEIREIRCVLVCVIIINNITLCGQ